MMRFLVILFFTCACIQMQAQVNIIITIAGKDTAGYCCDGGQATNAKLHYPEQLCLDNFGNLYIADAANYRIRKIVLSTGIISTVAGNGIGGFSGDNILATNAELWVPEAVCTDDAGNIYIGDAANYRIRKVTVSTGIITTIAGTGTSGNSGDGGPATNAEIGATGGLSMDKFGNLYLTDIENYVIRKITTNGIITTVAGNGTLGYSGDGGFATNAQFNVPEDIGIDISGNIIISDQGNQTIRKVDATTEIITTIAGDGTSGYSGDGGPATNAKLSYPYGIYIDKQNNIFFADHGNGVIRKIDGATGIISTVVGCGIQGFSGDGGPATNAKLIPDDVFLDSFGTMYIADFNNHRVRMVYNPQLGVASPSLSKGEVKVYPNPAREELTIENAKGGEVKIYNLLGQEVLFFDKLIMRSDKETVNVSSLTPGTYFVQVIDTTTGLRMTRRLVIVK